MRFTHQVYSCDWIILIACCIAGAEYIRKIINITHTLQVLNMGDNKIGDDGMAEISEALQCNKLLTTLRVDRCGLSVNGMV